MLIFKRNRPAAIFICPTDHHHKPVETWLPLISIAAGKSSKALARNSIRRDAVTVLCIKANALLGFTPNNISPIVVSLQTREYHEEAS